MFNYMKIIPVFFAALLAAGFARAAGAPEGVAAASEAAQLRAPGSFLVEIEGFTDLEGGIPCSPKSFSNVWHYKFYDGAQWLLVNACGGEFNNAAKHFPSDKAAEPARPLPRSFSAPSSVLKKLRAEGLFNPVPNRRDRDILMKIRYLPAQAGRPAGCYWTVSQGKQKAFVSCDGKSASAQSSGKTAAASVPKLAPKKVKGGETAGRSVKAACASARSKYPSAELMMVEAIPTRKGTLDCVASNNWAFVFRIRELSTYGTVTGGCGPAGPLDPGMFTNKYGNLGADALVLPENFKDSDEAVSVIPDKCPHPRVVMRLKNYRPAKSPVTGHPFLWEVSCGSKRYFVDAGTGFYLGEGR